MPHYVRTLSEMPSLPEDHVLLYAAPLFELLQVLWECELFHCDIKPANLFLDSHGKVYLGDFGSLTRIKNEEALSTAIFIPEELTRGGESGCGARSGPAVDAGMFLCSLNCWDGMKETK